MCACVTQNPSAKAPRTASAQARGAHLKLNLDPANLDTVKEDLLRKKHMRTLFYWRCAANESKNQLALNAKLYPTNRICMCVYLYTYIYMYIYIYTYMYIYKYIIHI